MASPHFVIDGANIIDGTITGSKIKIGSVPGNKLMASSILGSTIPDNEIEGKKIKENDLAGEKLVDSTVGMNKIHPDVIKQMLKGDPFSPQVPVKIDDGVAVTGTQYNLLVDVINDLLGKLTQRGISG